VDTDSYAEKDCRESSETFADLQDFSKYVPLYVISTLSKSAILN
jgi:hypothetical protein